MGHKFKCYECDYEVVLVSGCGIRHELICGNCERQLHKEGKSDTEFIGHSDENGDDSYRLKND